ncbi:3-oxoacyl-[acyl-carrier-protein] reductase [Geovibrio thiophilus]|uniref:3-oxoacyl-[acyl-carrier-protein] reductase n=1 Tax=Geovibrio thiophilus TaxID=139438 RepID=A0A3R5YXJ8_9BACT|nr:3-oxoacyl-[acyl-carrier-protein] reductase [Geovibrio thiophilus]QAR31907.1 3-oxoacyl-[acyl-carrier-protein] reductase [Geovibrio thiophilus]
MLKDKIALITGASRGIGRDIAIAFAAQGAYVAVNYSSSPVKAEEVVKAILDAGGRAFAVKANVSDEEEVKAMFDKVEEVTGSTVDVLVNNAGITKDGLLMRMKTEDWQTVMDVNLKSAFLCTRFAVKGMMKKRYGKIINVSSIVGFMGNAGQANYVASKAGLIGLTKTAALEFASRGIRVNAIAPGFITTDMTDGLSEEIQQKMISMIPLAAFGSGKDVADTALFLADSGSDYITGQTIHVNGGMYL